MWQVVLYITPKTVLLFVLAMLGLAGVGARWYHRAPTPAARAARFLLIAWGALILVATLTPTQPLGSSGHTIFWMPAEGMWGDTLDGLFPEERTMIVRLQLANAAMFVPFGATFAFAFFHARKRVLAWETSACLAFSMLIELVQFVMAAGRTVDVDDVLFNTLGGLLGTGVALAALNAFAISRRGQGRHRQPLADQ